jgi:hypothetical protein
MDKEEYKGEELNQLSRLLFNKAAHFWYQGLLFEIIAGFLGIILSFFELTDDLKLLFGILGFALLFIAYVRKLQFDNVYDHAETMRRQSVLSEALGWPISKTQFSKWKQKAGKKVLEKFRVTKRDDNYYETKLSLGPERLLEMTIESAFWGRHLYGKLKQYVWIIFAFIGALCLIAISIVPFNIIPKNAGLQIVYSIYLLLPLILSINLFGWAIGLTDLENSLGQIEEDLENLKTSENINTEQVMRLVSEYNCKVVKGFPILNKMFKWWHDEIEQAWKER